MRVSFLADLFGGSFWRFAGVESFVARHSLPGVRSGAFVAGRYLIVP